MKAFQHQKMQYEILFPHCFITVTKATVRNILYTVYSVWYNNTQLKFETPSIKYKLPVNFASLGNTKPWRL